MVYFAKPLDDPASCVSTYLVNELVAVISGSMTFQLDGATVTQVELAVRNTLSSSLGVSPEALTVLVSPGTRRLSTRRLALQSWSVTYHVVVPATSATAVVAAASSHSVDSSNVAALQVLDFTPVSAQ
eukprot:symbB.v1.2.041188.t1/scaffold7907.1/size8771/1